MHLLVDIQMPKDLNLIIRTHGLLDLRESHLLLFFGEHLGLQRDQQTKYRRAVCKEPNREDLPGCSVP